MSSSSSSSSSSSRMIDEMRVYRADDPNDAPERRLYSFVNGAGINPFIPTALPNYVIPSIANSLASMQMWLELNYSAYQQQSIQNHHHQQQHQLRTAAGSSSSRSSPHQGSPSSSRLFPQSPGTSGGSSLGQQQRQFASRTQGDAALHLEQQLYQQQQSLHHQRLNDNASSSSSSQISSPDIRQRLNNNHPQQTHRLLNNHTSAGRNGGANPHSSGPDDAQFQHQRIISSQHPDTLTTNTNNRHQRQQQDGNNPANSLSSSASSASSDSEQAKTKQQQQQHQHIKKPLNPFMIYMQKRRPEIVRQGIIKESAAINQMLGQQWRQLTKEEQEPYYKLAEQEKILHAQKYPGWSARDNYANQKKKKKLKLKSISLNGLDQSDKKCRARFGLTNMASWCKPCKRKKRCIYSLPSSKNDTTSSNNHNLISPDHLHQHYNHNLTHNSGHHLAGRLPHYPLQHSVTHMIN